MADRIVHHALSVRQQASDVQENDSRYQEFDFAHLRFESPSSYLFSIIDNLKSPSISRIPAVRKDLLKAHPKSVFLDDECESNYRFAQQFRKQQTLPSLSFLDSARRIRGHHNF